MQWDIKKKYFSQDLNCKEKKNTKKSVFAFKAAFVIGWESRVTNGHVIFTEFHTDTRWPFELLNDESNIQKVSSQFIHPNVPNYESSSSLITWYSNDDHRGISLRIGHRREPPFSHFLFYILAYRSANFHRGPPTMLSLRQLHPSLCTLAPCNANPPSDQPRHFPYSWCPSRDLATGFLDFCQRDGAGTLSYRDRRRRRRRFGELHFASESWRICDIGTGIRRSPDSSN